MSTVDPRVARLEREQRRFLPRLIFTIVLAAVHLVLWMIAGFGFGQIYDTFRLMSLNQVGAWTTGLDSQFPTLFVIGVFVGSALGFWLTTVAGRLIGVGGGMVLPLVTGSLGISLGLALFAPHWTTEQTYGQKEPFISGEPEPWGTDAWINYALPTWLPITFAAIAVVMLILLVILVLRRRGRGERMVRLLQHGRKVTGEVTETQHTGLTINDIPYLAVTVTFRDHLGTTRWVTKKGTFPTGPPRVGDPVVVWFDPSDPAQEKNIMVGFGPEDQINAAHTAGS